MTPSDEPKNTTLSERGRAQILAASVLDRINADPDDDLAILARQFNREVEARDRLAERVNNADELFMKISQLLDGWHSDIAWTEDDELLRNAITKWRYEKG